MFWDYEIANGINKAVARGDLTAEQGRKAVRLILAVQARRVPLSSPDESYELAQHYLRISSPENILTWNSMCGLAPNSTIETS
jgi:predicted nucleic acid-binding protein